MTNLKKIIFVIENITLKVGRTTSWLILFMTLIAFSVALLRYFFNIGFVWMQESYIWMHGLVFLLGSAYTLLDDKHVRVDIFYDKFSIKTKAIIQIITILFFVIPLSTLIVVEGLPFVEMSFLQNESSGDPGGLCCRWIIKSSMVVGFLVVLIQSITELKKAYIKLKGN